MKLTREEYDTLNRAAELLEEEAHCLRDCSTVDDDWTGEEDAREAHDEMMETATQVRLFIVRHL